MKTEIYEIRFFISKGKGKGKGKGKIYKDITIFLPGKEVYINQFKEDEETYHLDKFKICTRPKSR